MFVTAKIKHQLKNAKPVIVFVYFCIFQENFTGGNVS